MKKALFAVCAALFAAVFVLPFSACSGNGGGYRIR